MEFPHNWFAFILHTQHWISAESLGFSFDRSAVWYGRFPVRVRSALVFSQCVTLYDGAGLVMGDTFYDYY